MPSIRHDQHNSASAANGFNLPYPDSRDAQSPSGSTAGNAASLQFNELYRASSRLTESLDVPFAFPGVIDNPIGALHCASTTINDHGRLSDRSSLKALRWAPGQFVSFDGDHRIVVARCARQSRWAVGRAGYLRIPSANRHRCNLNPGDRALIAADLSRDILVVLPIAVVATALWNYLSDAWQ